MSNRIESQVFGLSQIPDEQELMEIQSMTEKFPVTVFQELNKLLNKRSLCLKIDTVPGVSEK